jgi:hypothetical protein
MITTNKVCPSANGQQLFIIKTKETIVSTKNEPNNHSLKMETAHKMISQFFTEKKISKEELAQLLGISLKDFEKLNSVCEYKQAPASASYKLLCLYCRTNWEIYEITKKEGLSCKKKKLTV